MDCKTARQLLAVIIHPSELAMDEAAALADHLADCAECGTLAQDGRREDDAIGQALRAVAIPLDFRERLLAGLGRERRRWHLRLARRLAAAAALLAVAWLGYGYWTHANRPEIDLERIVDDALAVRGQPPEQIEQWFYDQYRIKTVLPRDLNYAWLISRGREDFQGRPVPRLLFTHGEFYARVFVLSTKQFKVSAPPRAGSGGITVDLRPCPNDPGIVYLIEYNSGSLDWLILEVPSGA